VKQFLSTILIPFLLTFTLCSVTVFDRFYTESPLPETVHYTLRLGHGTYTPIPKNYEMVRKALSDIEEELNVKIKIVDSFVYEAPKETLGLMWTVLECKGQGDIHAQNESKIFADLTICLDGNMISNGTGGVAVPALGSMVAHTWEKNLFGEFYNKTQLKTISINTIKHEIGHLLGCEHSRSGIMFWRAKLTDYESIGKFSNESIREVKEYHNG